MAERKYNHFPRVLPSGRQGFITCAKIEPHENGLFPVQVLTRLPYDANEMGLPKPGELARVQALMRKVVEALEGQDVLDAGRIIGNGEMVQAFRAAQAPAAEIKVSLGFLKKATFALESFADDDWAWFKANFEPDPIEYEISHNKEHLRQLAEHGDKPEIERDVDFFFYFPTESAANEFIQVATAEGYRLEAANEKDRDYSVQLVLASAVTEAIIAARCAFLRKTAAEFGGIFDGWGCPIAD